MRIGLAVVLLAALLSTAEACSRALPHGADLSLLQPQQKHHRRRLQQAVKQPKSRACGVAPPSLAAQLAVKQAEAATYGRAQGAFASTAALSAAVAASAFPATPVTLPTLFHIVHWQNYSSADQSVPPLSSQQIVDQLAVLNRDFDGTGLQFAAPTVRRWANLNWTGNCWNNLGAILAATNTAPEKAVNVIICDLASSAGILGITPDMPNGYNEKSATSAVVIDFRTLPGGPYTQYSGGRTLTHELGHYFGLLHVFGSGAAACTADGGADFILDTPAQADATIGCPANKDTCPDQPGLDAITNFMDYSDDPCMRSFTIGQVARMQAVTLQYRPTLLAIATGSTAAPTPVARPPPPSSPRQLPPPPRTTRPPPPMKRPPPPPPKRPPPPPPKRSPPPPSGQTKVVPGGTQAKPPPPPKRPPPPPPKRSPPPPKVAGAGGGTGAGAVVGR